MLEIEVDLRNESGQNVTPLTPMRLSLPDNVTGGITCSLTVYIQVFYISTWHHARSVTSVAIINITMYVSTP